MRLARLAFAFAAFVALYAGAEERVLRGEAAFVARIAVPDSAMLVVETRDAAGALFSEMREPTAGRQVPLPFALAAPPEGGTLRAAIRLDGETRWLSPPAAIPLSGPVDALRVTLEPFSPMAFVSRMRCGTEEVLVGVDKGAVVIEARGDRYRLAPVPAASGAQYALEGDPETYFWSKGGSALVSLAGEALPECAVAPLPAPEFRAGGNEPGWDFAIRGGEAALTLDYGAKRRAAPLPPPGIGPDGETVIVSDALGATVRISEELCRDDATGMPHPFAVSVETDGRRLGGCGGRPLDLLLGGEWTVAEIGGAPVSGEGLPTLLFFEEGRVAGLAGCNRYFAGFALTGEGLSFSGAGMTMMACAEDLMARERAFGAALKAAASFDIVEDALVLRGADGAELLRARR